MAKQKYSRIWTISKEELQIIIDKSTSFKEVLGKIGKKYVHRHRELKQRINELDIDISELLKSRKILQKKHLNSLNVIIPLEEMLTKESKYDINNIRRRLIKEKVIDYSCFKCGIVDWQNEPLSLHLDHADGDRENNRIENLRFLCPNCHQQTDTWGSKNRKQVGVA